MYRKLSQNCFMFGSHHGPPYLYFPVKGDIADIAIWRHWRGRAQTWKESFTLFSHLSYSRDMTILGLVAAVRTSGIKQCWTSTTKTCKFTTFDWPFSGMCMHSLLISFLYLSRKWTWGKTIYGLPATIMCISGSDFCTLRCNCTVFQRKKRANFGKL